MPKPFPILLNVEEIALGPVLRKLHDMPGVISVDLQLGHGGQGAGRDHLQRAATGKREDHAQTAIKLLMQGPISTDELSKAIGGKRSRAYGVLHHLKKKRLIEGTGEKSVYQLSAKARAQLGGMTPALALPAPAAKKVKRGPAGRAAPGSGNIILRTELDAGPVTPADLRDKMSAHGMSPKSISGVLDRARRDELIKKNGTGYTLTAKGRKIEAAGAQAHG